MILIGNDGQAMKRAKITVEHVRRPTIAEMTRTLFCDHGMDVTKAQRLSHLSNGDWRALRMLEAYFAQVDVASLAEGEFELAVASTAKDKPRAEAMHPSFATHILFSGQADKHCGGLEELADYGVLAWGERNLGVACGTIEEMARMQEECESRKHAPQRQRGGARSGPSRSQRCAQASDEPPLRLSGLQRTGWRPE